MVGNVSFSILFFKSVLLELVNANDTAPPACMIRGQLVVHIHHGVDGHASWLEATCTACPSKSLLLVVADGAARAGCRRR